MTVRPLKGSDLIAILEMANRSGFENQEPSSTDHILVVEDDEGKPVAAGGIRMIPEVYLWCGPFRKPLAKVHAIRLLHTELGEFLKRRGFDRAYAFPVASIAEKFGRRLEKTFGWTRNSPIWFRKL